MLMATAATAPSAKMVVQVKKVSGETFDVEVQDNQMPVGQFKQALANLCGIPPPQQRLICNGQNLEDHAPLVITNPSSAAPTPSIAVSLVHHLPSRLHSSAAPAPSIAL